MTSFTTADIERAVVRFIHGNLFHVPAAADRERIPSNTQAFDARRVNVEELILNEPESSALRFLRSERLGGGGTRHDWITTDRVGIHAEFDDRAGVIPWLTVIDFTRARRRDTFACLTCGGQFTTGFLSLPLTYNGAVAAPACRFWRCPDKRGAFVRLDPFADTIAEEIQRRDLAARNRVTTLMTMLTAGPREEFTQSPLFDIAASETSETTITKRSNDCRQASLF